MSDFEDVCWHEAAHAVIAGAKGLMTFRCLVRQNSTGTDWVGFRQGVKTEPELVLYVAAAGMAGELMQKFASFAEATHTDLTKARTRSKDDRQRYDEVVTQTVLNIPFEKFVEIHAWPILQKFRDHLDSLARELMEYKKIGPLVISEAMYKMPITKSSRDADHDFLNRLEATSPAPQVP